MQLRSCADPFTIESSWRALERKGMCSPYQRFAWASEWYRHACAALRQRAAIVTITDAAGEIVGILPLVVERTGPVSALRFAGQDHSNINMGVFDPDRVGMLDALADRRMLLRLGEAVGGVDILDFQRQPLAWEGRPNPYATLPSYRTETMPTLDLRAHVDQPPPQLSKSTRRKFSQKLKWLGEIGPVEFVTVEDAATATRVLDTFLAQKRERMARQNIENPFADPAIEAFLRAVATSGTADDLPGLSLFAVMSSDVPVAVLGCCESTTRLSGSIISFEAAPPFGRCSPGELLALDVIKKAWTKGLHVFDLGAGNDSYKARFCEQRETVVSVAAPLTLRGRLFLDALRLSRAAKARLAMVREAASARLRPAPAAKDGVAQKDEAEEDAQSR